MKTRFFILMLLALPIISLHAQVIIFEDFEPDLFVHNGYPDTLLFDFDQDDSTDILYRFDVNSVGYWFYIDAINPNLEFALCEENDVIPELSDWKSFLWWSNEKMFGYRIKKDNDYYYGWFRVYNYLPGGQLYEYIGVYFDKYAYCAIPNYPLVWGQAEIVGIDENDYPTAFATVHPNPTTGLVTIAGDNLRQAEVLNMLGQQVLSMQGEGNELRIDMAALPAGVYFVNVTDDEGRKCVRKVVKE